MTFPLFLQKHAAALSWSSLICLRRSCLSNARQNLLVKFTRLCTSAQNRPQLQVGSYITPTFSTQTIINLTRSLPFSLKYNHLILNSRQVDLPNPFSLFSSFLHPSDLSTDPNLIFPSLSNLSSFPWSCKPLKFSPRNN